jgi:sugar phosphate isomerase/epimerase
MAISRRAVLAGLGAAAASSAWPRAMGAATSFNLSILTDEISQDFGHACEVAAREFGLGLVDLREAANKNIMNWDAAQIAEVRRVLDRFKLRVACIASPVFKVDWPGAPKSPFSPQRDEFGASFTYEQQGELLERAFELARTFNTDRIRIFDFWRLEDQQPHRKAIDDVVRAAAVKAGARGLTLVLENEYACNTATGTEAARLLYAIPDKALQLTWDPGNAQFRDEVPFPGGYAALPKERIGHVHCKDAVRAASGKWEWMAMGRGTIDWAGQFRALTRDGYRHACTLETHWRGAGTPEESSRQSFAGMKALIDKAGTA